MRNFWIEATIDGKKTKLASGPRSKDGGFELFIYQRVNGESVNVLTVTGHAPTKGEDSGQLHLVVFDASADIIHRHCAPR